MCCTSLPRVLPVVVCRLKFWVVENFLPRPTPFQFFPPSCHVYKSTVAHLSRHEREQHRLLHRRPLFDGFWPWLSRKALCDRAFRATYICQWINQVSIGSDNGLPPIWRTADNISCQLIFGGAICDSNGHWNLSKNLMALWVLIYDLLFLDWLPWHFMPFGFCDCLFLTRCRILSHFECYMYGLFFLDQRQRHITPSVILYRLFWPDDAIQNRHWSLLAKSGGTLSVNIWAIPPGLKVMGHYTLLLYPVIPANSHQQDIRGEAPISLLSNSLVLTMRCSSRIEGDGTLHPPIIPCNTCQQPSAGHQGRGTNIIT